MTEKRYVPVDSNCPKCNGQMEMKGKILGSATIGFMCAPKVIVQCESCKNIEIVKTHLMDFKDDTE